MIRMLLHIYQLIIIADVILSYFPQYQNNEPARLVHKLSDYTLAPIRKILPADLPFDFSPMVVIIGLEILMALW